MHIVAAASCVSGCCGSHYAPSNASLALGWLPVQLLLHHGLLRPFSPKTLLMSPWGCCTPLLEAALDMIEHSPMVSCRDFSTDFNTQRTRTQRS